MLNTYKDRLYSPDGFLKHYSKDYNERRKGGAVIDLLNDQPDFVTKFEFMSYVIDKSLERLDHAETS